MVGVDDGQADRSGERDKGSLFDENYRMTVYHHAEEKLNPGGGRETIYSYKTCEAIAGVSGNFKSQLQLQGSGSLLNERVVTFIAECQGSCDTYCYELVEEGIPFGKGANNRPVIPYRTVAVDDEFLALGRKLYIPQLDGVEMPGDDYGFVHNGCVLAGDTGSAIQGQDLDFFTPTQENGNAVEILLEDTLDVANSGHGNPIVDIYKGGEHCRNFGVNQGWVGDPCSEELDCLEGLSCAKSPNTNDGLCTLPDCETTCPDLYEGGYEQTRCVIASGIDRFSDMGTACAIECSSGNDGESPCREGLSCEPVEWVGGGTKNVCI